MSYLSHGGHSSVGRRFAAFATIVTAVFLGACGNDDDSSTAAEEPSRTSSGARVPVIAQDIKFAEGEYTAKPGTVTIEYRNDGNIPHTLVIEGVDGFKLDVERKGARDADEIELETGTYTLYCDVPGHRDAGMEAELKIS